jgi:hypothetical protein
LSEKVESWAEEKDDVYDEEFADDDEGDGEDEE